MQGKLGPPAYTRAYGARTDLAPQEPFPCISLHPETVDFQAKRI